MWKLDVIMKKSSVQDVVVIYLKMKQVFCSHFSADLIFVMFATSASVKSNEDFVHKLTFDVSVILNI